MNKRVGMLEGQMHLYPSGPLLFTSMISHLSLTLSLQLCELSSTFLHPSHSVGLENTLQFIIIILFWMDNISNTSTLNHFLKSDVEVTFEVLGYEMNSNKRHIV